MTRTTALLHRFLRDARGATAVEFAALALPLFMTIFVVFELSIHHYVWTSINHAVQKTARQIQTRSAEDDPLDLDAFKASVCGEVGHYFGCSTRLLLKVDVVRTVSSASTTDPVHEGVLALKETFDPGGSGDFLLVQAFFRWPAFFRLVSLGGRQTRDGEYVLSATSLVRNEPF